MPRNNEAPRRTGERERRPLRLVRDSVGFAPPPAGREAGFSLVETMVATVLLSMSLVAVAQLFALSTRANMTAKTTTAAAVMAHQKMEQLRGLAWGFDSQGLALSDFETGGKGLTASPPDSLRTNSNGYVDYLDAFGASLGGGDDPPDRTLYVRRWSIEPLPTNPNNTLILQVFVFRIDGRGANLPNDNQPVSRFPEEARLVTVKTRKAR